MTNKFEGRCAACGAAFKANATGRPRRFCAACSTPAAAARRWREANVDRVRARKRRGRGLRGSG